MSTGHSEKPVDVNDNSSNGVASKDSTGNLWPIERQLEEVHKIAILLARNKYLEAIEILKEHSHDSMFHAYAYSWVMSIRAVMYFKKASVFEEALDACNGAVKLVEAHRKPRGWSSYLKHADCDSMTDEQCHAELIYTEMQALFAFLEPAQNKQSFMSFVRAAYRIRSYYQSLQECERILKNKTNWQNQSNRHDFEAGILMGLGLFEIAISYFPSKLIMLLELAGFSSDRLAGMDKLYKAAQLKHTIRYVGVAIALGGIHGFGEYFYGIGEPNVAALIDVIDYFTVNAPESVYVSLGHAFVEQNKGHYEKASEYYTQFSTGQNVLKSMGFFGNWQKIWVYGCLWDWPNAVANVKYLVDKCSWSPATFMYIYGTCLLMQSDSETDPIKKQDLLEEAIEAMSKVNKLKKNFGGRRAFHEKLVTENAKRFLERPESAILPILELFYVWNGFQTASCNDNCLPMFIEKIESKMKIHTKEQSLDNHAYLTFMRGMCLTHNKKPMAALDCFLEVIGHGKKVQWAKNLAPQASFEMAQIYRRSGDYEQSKAWLKKTLKYSGYITDSLINFRVHYVMDLIKAKEGEADSDA